jgi:hypothetical protein
MPPFNFIFLETVATILLALGALGLVTEREQWPTALTQLYANVSPLGLLLLGIALSALALLFLLAWNRRRRLDSTS